MSDYLWDKDGDPDPEIARLERLLSRFGQPASVRFEFPASASRSRGSRWFGAALLAASLAIVVGGVTFALRFRPSVPGWTVTIADRQSTLAVGNWLETGKDERATFNVANIGQVTIEPNTRLRLLDTRAGAHRLALAHGTMRATIWAPPNQFFVETPSTLAVDLGCAYTLTMDDEGAGLVNVLVGWVGFKWRDRESFIPAGSSCPTRPRFGPGTPYNDRVSPEYREALATIDFTPDSPDFVKSAQPPDTSMALALVLNQSTERDEVTLWHLLSRVPPGQRDRVFDRLATFAPPPPSVTREGIRDGNRQMLDAWWDALGLGSTSLWRTWSQQWKDTTADRR
jgi:FecR protein